MCFRRTASGEEIDFVVDSGRRLLPIEVKSGRVARVADARAPFGLLVYDGKESLRLTDRVVAVPLGAIL